MPAKTSVFDSKKQSMRWMPARSIFVFQYFPWVRFRITKSVVKLHALLDLRSNIPSFVDITEGKVHDVNVLDIMIPEAGAIYFIDSG